jgi:hypothetical protein
MKTTATFPSSAASNLSNAGFFTETATDSMQVSGVQYGTSNSPGTDSVNNVVYVSTAQDVGPSSLTQPGALMRFQIDSSGNITSRTQEFLFPGPSGASPVVVPNYHYTPLARPPSISVRPCFSMGPLEHPARHRISIA